MRTLLRSLMRFTWGTQGPGRGLRRSVACFFGLIKEDEAGNTVGCAITVRREDRSGDALDDLEPSCTVHYGNQAQADFRETKHTSSCFEQFIGRHIDSRSVYLQQ